MRRPLVPQNPTIARINVMPIIDVALVLVVILLITAPMITVRDLELTLPEAQTRGAEDELRVSITLGENGLIAVDEDLVALSNLGRELTRRIEETDRDVLVVVRADSDSHYETVQEILRQARSAGAHRLAIATRQGEGS
jgi:biopolymer transport protein ExbD